MNNSNTELLKLSTLPQKALLQMLWLKLLVAHPQIQNILNLQVNNLLKILIQKRLNRLFSIRRIVGSLLLIWRNKESQQRTQLNTKLTCNTLKEGHKSLRIKFISWIPISKLVRMEVVEHSSIIKKELRRRQWEIMELHLRVYLRAFMHSRLGIQLRCRKGRKMCMRLPVIILRNISMLVW